MSSLTTEEAATYAGVTGKTIRKWIQDGMLKAERIYTSRCQYSQTIKEEDLEQLLEAKACNVPPKQRQHQTSVGAPLLSYDDLDHQAKQRALLDSAKRGDEQAILTLRLPWEKGGYGVTRMVLRGVEII